MGLNRGWEKEGKGKEELDGVPFDDITLRPDTGIKPSHPVLE